MRICIIVLVLILIGCKSPKKEYDFTFYKGNIHESYFLNFNSSDTLYFTDVYGYDKEETSFTILSKEEKEKIDAILDTITFSKMDSFQNNKIEDGTTNAFVLRKGKQTRKLKIHGGKGPSAFWIFGKTLEKIKLNHKFNKTNKKIDLKEINEMVLMKVPPSFVFDTLQ